MNKARLPFFLGAYSVVTESRKEAIQYTVKSFKAQPVHMLHGNI